MKSNKLPCNNCGELTPIRTTIREGEHNGKKVCSICATKLRTAKPDKPPKFKRQSSSLKVGPRRSHLRSITPKTAAKKKDRANRRAVYFDHHIALCRRSEESGTYINEPTRSNICHIFPKANHQSVEDDLGNVIYYTLNEHTKFDTYLLRYEFDKLEQEFPNSWDTVCNRMESLLPRVKENTKFKRNIQEYLSNKK